MSLLPDRSVPDATTLEAAYRDRRSRQYRVRTLMTASVVSAVWLGFLRLPGALPMLGGVLAVAGIVLGVFLGAVGLAFLGFGLFALFDRAVAWVKGPGPKPGPVDDWWV